jgi:hypothetical protein
MNASDRWLLKRAHRNRPLPAESETDEPKREPLVSQGGRSAGIPRQRQMTPDDLIRSYRSDRSVWTRIF